MFPSQRTMAGAVPAEPDFASASCPDEGSANPGLHSVDGLPLEVGCPIGYMTIYMVRSAAWT
jgi:hypothetical protein